MDKSPPLKNKEADLKLLKPSTWIPRKKKEERGESSDVKPTQELRHKIPEPNPTKNPPDELMDDYKSEDEGIVFPDNPMLQQLLATSRGRGRGLSGTESTGPPELVGHEIFASGYGQPRSPFRPESQVEIFGQKSVSNSAELKSSLPTVEFFDPFDVPIVLRSDEIPDSTFRTSLLSGTLLPNPLNHTGWYVMDVGPFGEEVLSERNKRNKFWVIICDYLAAAEHWDTLYGLRTVNQQLSDLSAHRLLANDWRIYPASKSARYPYTTEDTQDKAGRLLPKMPTGPFLSAKEEYRQGRVLTLFPSGCDCQATVDVEIIKQMAVGEDQHFQFLKGRIGRVESLDDEVHWRRLQGKNVELYLFDPLRISLESYTDHKLGTTHANFNRRSTVCGNYQQLLSAFECFSGITLESSTKPLCPEPLLASVFFPNRELIDDRGAVCIVMEAWPCESLAHLIILDREKTDDLVFEILLTIKELMEAGWQHNRLEQSLYINLDNLDIFVDPITLSRATPIGDKVEPEHLKEEIKLAVKRMRPRGTSPTVDRMVASLLDSETSITDYPWLPFGRWPRHYYLGQKPRFNPDYYE